ncbi:TPA: hypothetical protein ACG4S2_001032 [Legionella pneumophila]|uniref:Uncharacterized protein n=1 Tax=Legionella pneumophila TaxID=446 RepID=A0A378K2X1_LEGPN|nr:hypothetical protein [Legionella pneumophila]MCW8434363.1 hypothetical protein [Legionella pneumophila]MCW8467033.1 hypothetical protein [Legionella pneumophila]MCW8476698.1 hypothetical protein [Legionella pneumophila]MCZ4687132.1 hypothetical protein [Legionella pneumophila]MCZ4690750.1 hypothetical protein [Legionella pneumophila]
MVRFITEEDLEVFEQERELDDAAREAEQRWLEEVKKSHQGEIEYDDTYPLYEEYIKLHNKWCKFYDEHANILLGQEVK